MQAIIVHLGKDSQELRIGNWEMPKMGPEEIRVKVAATALNRADLLQKKGMYPPPPGASPILGLEMAGEVVECGEKVEKWKLGDRVCSLLSGGGYAEYAVVHENMALAIPPNLSFKEAAAIPEVFLTAYQALIWLAELKEGENVLIHAGASGVGTACIQIAKSVGATIWVTASAGKHENCLALGASHAIDYKSENFEEVVCAQTDDKGVDVVLDFLAAPYFQKNLNVLSLDGRMVMLALMGGMKAEGIHLAPLLVKRLRIMGSTLRSRTLAYKIALTQDFAAFAWEQFHNGSFKPVVDSVYPWQEVEKAHARMEANLNVGKIILELGG